MDIIDLSEKVVELPSYVTAYGWIPFVVAVVLSLVFSTLFVKYFWSQNDRDKCSSIVSTIGITIALLSAVLIPVDVFLVSFMKNSNGTFKEWATNSTRQALEDSVTFTYYSLYGTTLFFTFFILPLVYFSYEERDEDQPTRVFTTAFLYTTVFVLVMAGLLIAGAFIPFKPLPQQNSTNWEKIDLILKEIYASRGKDAITFVVNILTIYGMLNLILYTSVGLASFPIGLIKGFRSLSEEESVLSENQMDIQSKINALRSKQAQKSLSYRETSRLAELEEEESLISKRSVYLDQEKQSIFHKCGPCFRIFNVIIGCAVFAFSILLLISLLLVNIDKVMNSLGMQMGYVLTTNMLPNPLDYIMVKAQTVFPIDYVLFFCIIIFLVMCTISGMRYLGICCLCVPMYKMRPRRTPPQGLIMVAFILIFSVLGFHVLMHSVLPSYTTFGSQYYCDANLTTPTSPCILRPCTLTAPPDECIMTRGASFVLSFAYKAWIFGAVYFWLTWVFLVVLVISFFYIVIRSKRSSLEEAIDRDDFDDSDEPMIRI